MYSVLHSIESERNVTDHIACCSTENLFNVKTLIYSEAQRIASDQFWSTLYSLSTVSTICDTRDRLRRVLRCILSFLMSEILAFSDVGLYIHFAIRIDTVR